MTAPIPAFEQHTELTTFQNRWVYWYTHPECLFNGTEAAKRAGYGGTEQPKNQLWRAAYDNTRNHKVIRIVKERLRKLYAAAEVSVQTVLEELEQNRIAALANGNYTAANQATALKGKYLKMFVDRIEHIHTIEEASTEELQDLLAELIGKVDGISIDRLLTRDGTDASGSDDRAGDQTTH